MFRNERFMSVDMESDGPIPGDFSMLSIGACLVDDPKKVFYVELQPISEKFEPEALEVNGLDRKRLIREGVRPDIAMIQFERWIEDICSVDNAKPVFLGFNAPFDRSFVNWYFIHFLGRNPFGYDALDIKAYYMGATGKEKWSDTRKSRMDKPYRFELDHTAQGDAPEQAKAFSRIREHRRQELDIILPEHWEGTD